MARRAKPPRFTEGQEVTLTFSPPMKPEYTMPATIIRNIDDTCHPLTDYWLVKLETGFQFGFTGKAISPRPAA
jgi:hypothetical protein